uniref:Uncharacterized protein n=2 Tax=Rhodosorus marinus TaxID=101924 RepID=A0A7S0BLL1_9RHOD|mmetsp:Transcript_21112/g.30687  ORF Transcript_21112/g.30687 Transcript_21112/m.30687 type:complete len:335 (+) Transcript_21112:72-1076(+)
MVSMSANPVLIGCMSFEYLFVLDHRLSEQSNLPSHKRSEILGEAIGSVFNDLFMQSVFQKSRVYSEEAVRQIFFEATQSPSLRISQESFAKFFSIVSMTFKAHLLRVNRKSDLVGLVNNQFRELRRILDEIGEYDVIRDVDKFRIRLIEWFEEMSYGEFARMRETLINATRTFKTAVTILVGDKLQAPNGGLVFPIGTKDLSLLGHCVLFDGDGTEVVSYDLPVAGKNLVDPDFIIGENRFRRKQLNFGAGQDDEEEYERKLAEIYSDTEEEIDYGNYMLESEFESDEDLAGGEKRMSASGKRRSRRSRKSRSHRAGEGVDQKKKKKKKSKDKK